MNPEVEEWNQSSYLPGSRDHEGRGIRSEVMKRSKVNGNEQNIMHCNKSLRFERLFTGMRPFLNIHFLPIDESVVISDTAAHSDNIMQHRSIPEYNRNRNIE